MEDFGIKVSKPTRDVKTETDVKQLIFTSGKGVFGFRSKTTHQITTGADGKASGTFAHGFGYTPIPIVFVNNRAGERILVPSQWQSNWNVDEDLEEVFHMRVDGTNIYLFAYAHHYETFMGGADTPLNGQQYTFTVFHLFNEMIETA